MLRNIGSERPAVSEWASALSWGHDEANLVHELQTGSGTAFDWLVTHYHAPVYNLILGMLGDTSDAADGTQEVFLKAFRGIRNFRRGSSLKTWLYRIAIREALNHKRWFKRHLQKNVSIDAEPEEGRAHIEIEDRGATPFEQLLAVEIQGAAHRHLNFHGRKLLKRSGATIFDFNVRAPFFRLGIDGNVFLQMPLEPALVVQRFANGDAVKPSLQGAALAEIANSAKGFQENFLGAVGRVRGVAQHAKDEVINRRMIVGDEPVECRLRACLQLVDEVGFIVAP